MNPNEAAEIVRDRTAGSPRHSLRDYLKARETLVCAAIDWLDTTPITEEWLRANGWNLNVLQWVNGDSVIVQVDKGKWMLPGWPIVFQTIGELRTLLRLCEQEKETDA